MLGYRLMRLLVWLFGKEGYWVVWYFWYGHVMYCGGFVFELVGQLGFFIVIDGYFVDFFIGFVLFVCVVHVFLVCC